MGSPSSPAPPPVASETFERLARDNASRVRRLVRRAGVPAADENDVIQEVLLALHLASGRGLAVSTSLRDWLKTTTYRIARDRLKLAYNARERLTEQGAIEPRDEADGPEESMQRIDVRHLVDVVLDDLPPPLRLVLVMSDADEMPMSQIAEILEIPLGTGYSRLRVARREFASAWRKRCEEEAPHVAAYGIAPFLLFDAGALCDMEREGPELPGGFEDQVWDRLARALGTVGSGKSVGVHLSSIQIAVGVVASALAGAGLFALVAARPVDPPQATITNDSVPVVVALSQPANTSPAPVLVLSAAATAHGAAMATPTPSAAAGARAPTDRETVERNVLERARASFGRAAIAPDDRVRDQEIAAALAAVADHEQRFPNALYAQQRELLRRQILAYQSAHPAQEGGHP